MGFGFGLLFVIFWAPIFGVLQIDYEHRIDARSRFRLWSDDLELQARIWTEIKN